MVAVPFIYFILLLFFHLRKTQWKFDIACLILVVYAVSAFFSIFVEALNLRSPITYRVSFVATIMYCVLLTICLLPFLRYSETQIRSIQPLKKTGLLKFFSVVLFLYFIINLYMSMDAIVESLIMENMASLRNEHYAGTSELTWMGRLPFVARLPFTLLGYLSGSSWIFIFLAFYCFLIQKINPIYSFCFLIVSLNGVVGNFLMAGRSAVIYWVLSFIACYIFFKPLMNDKQTKWLRRLFVVFGALMLFYMASVTMARFGGDLDSGMDEDSLYSLLYYAGVSYPNFCYFFDTFECPMPTLYVLFPFTYKIMGSPIEGGVDLQVILSGMSHKDLGTFYTFLGQILTTSYNFVAVIYCIILALFAMPICKKVKTQRVTIKTCYCYLMFSSVLFLGLFGHYYAYATKTSSIFAFLVIFSFYKSKKTERNTLYKTDSSKITDSNFIERSIYGYKK